MVECWKKLNLRTPNRVVVLDAPDSFHASLQQLAGHPVSTSAADLPGAEFALAFVTRREQIAALAKQFQFAADEDPVLWFAYPKGTSKRLTCDFNRDSGWEPLREAGLRGVRQVSIDEDWTALRFRRSQQVGKR